MGGGVVAEFFRDFLNPMGGGVADIFRDLKNPIRFSGGGGGGGSSINFS